MPKLDLVVDNDRAVIIEVEQCLIGMLLAENAYVADVRSHLHTEMFTDDMLGAVFQIIVDHAAKALAVDTRTIQPLVSDHHFTGADCSKAEYFSNFVPVMMSRAQAVAYARHIAEWHGRRMIRQLLDTPMGEREKAAALSALWREIGTSDVRGSLSLSAAMDRTFDKIDAAVGRGGGLAGLSTGLRDLDECLCGLEAGGLYVVAGRPAMGKTALGLTIAMNAATAGHHVIFFSLEMSAEQLVHRVNARYSGVPMWEQKNGSAKVDFVKLLEAKQRLADASLTIVDKAGLTADQIVAKAAELGRGKRPALIVVDHLGIVAARDLRSPRVHQVAEMTLLFKAMAKDMEVPVLLLHQLNRGVEGRDDKRPSLGDLRDSGSVEQDADAVMLLYRAEYYLKDREPIDPNQRQAWFDRLSAATNKADIIVGKNRQGEARTVSVRFDGVRQVFEDFAEGVAP